MSVRVYRQVVTALRTYSLVSDRRIGDEPVSRTLTLDRVELTPEAGGETATHYRLAETHATRSNAWTMWAEEYANEDEASAHFDTTLDMDSDLRAAFHASVAALTA